MNPFDNFPFKMSRIILFFLAGAALIHSAANDPEIVAKKFGEDLVAKAKSKDVDGIFDLIYAKFIELFPGLLNDLELQGLKEELDRQKEILNELLNSTNGELKPTLKKGNTAVVNNATFEDNFFKVNQFRNSQFPVSKELAQFWKHKFDALGKESKLFVSQTVRYARSFRTLDRIIQNAEKISEKIDSKFNKLSKSAKVDLLKQFPFFGKLKDMKATAKVLRGLELKQYF
ncbi:hypothetical protein PMAYCL1PPCAC_28103 [Pristionchus mayeri]|uniref:Fatty-acid and retinol-binding protein 1 n=1 Tax=Pristionchus mayeri TaxID=1317129 RepID=A0AAN5D7E9_9BILA|nr:hypothetical protein PMAYCL1PPCAC_28103 [Pristionchus mayeri]